MPQDNPPGEIRIGISGWTYPPWRGPFYPKGLTQKRELEYASRQVNSIEINGSFYSLQSAASYQKWHDETPDDFVFAVKGGQFITHIKRLKDIRMPLATFFASGVLLLGEKLGPILWQFPPNFVLDAPRFDEFFELLPQTTKFAAKLAKEHGPQIESPALPARLGDRPVRHAVEVRHPSFATPGFVKLARRHGIAIVVADAANEWPRIEDVTAHFLYLRLHGHEETYASGYTDEALEMWAQRIRKWSAGGQPKDARLIDKSAKTPKLRGGRDVFVYFDNDLKVRSPADAMSLSRKFGIGPKT